MKDSPRIFVPQSEKSFSPGLEQRLNPAQAHYLGTVMRLTSGDEVRIFNAGDGEWSARIDMMRRGECRVVLSSCLRPGVMAGELQGATLAFALLKRDATDLVIRMGTELGVRHFIPLVTERTNTHRANLARLSAIAIEAAEQCERLDIPEIAPITSLASFLQSRPAGTQVFVGLERSNAPFPTRIPTSYVFLVGPEGGFSEREVSELKKLNDVCAISLGKTVLRADTAAIAGLSALSIVAQNA
ncbi:16S rRNA (uracil(1498)-N(3))-methyltransferase [Candidatus Kirkpatrickella diaphorinae]|uniref:Ribosomal RNA small subunit methyltransferase E n=1 Tax=Candidatus Kirkpatrickella diaphorinae TaxID=2984322 RepID=A0ABY6GKK2_9PROT|nr:16S rRNA (uracil(1498)-N(3))-methyltransferase [Candidatus Kirkpatrickella diaphorinae]UYH52067.1 16S rRNA (uracil(1498)-N(3))-methyltransferase [Candidatus Kirkpatrickella diaphorinae]